MLSFVVTNAVIHLRTMSLRSQGSSNYEINPRSEILGEIDFNLPATTELETNHSEISKQGGGQTKSPCKISLVTIELLKHYGNGFKCLKGKTLLMPGYNRVCSGTGALALSTEQVMKVARARLFEYFSHSSNDLPNHPNDDAVLRLSYEGNKNVELAQFLLASAEKVSNQQYDQASALLNICNNLYSVTGNSVQRVVYHFVEALQERIDRETKRISSQELKDDNKYQLNLRELMSSPTPAMLACLQELPYIQPTHFTGIQAIVENVINAKRVHIIHLEIRTGVQWTVLMQALVAQYNCPLLLLKISDVVTTSSKLRKQEIGKRLVDFADTINLPLSFKMVMVSDFKDLKKEEFDLEDDEVLVIYSSSFLKSLLRKPDCLKPLMTVIQNLQPCIMVVTEVEANHNSQAFMDRFIEALFYYSAAFDNFEACMELDPNRMFVEALYLNQAIRSIVLKQGEERIIRHEKIDYLRALFARFGMVEVALSATSLYQANLVIRKLPCGNSFTLTLNGKCLTIGWKGTPIFSVSVWKFPQRDR